ncbi:EAL domain-containing protein [Aromatoleum sp.]|uniref:EAL domain-containing protein n=1 Tax=Aromatoleum sp. TaxID=2307007 RepID=UPI002FC687B0
MHILYVEDSDADADLTRRALARAAPDITIEIANTLAAASQRLAGETRFDLVLSDLNLPDGSGLDLLSHVRMEQRPLAFVLLTGSGDQDAALAALKAGADDYQAKRSDYLAHLPDTLRSALARFRGATLARVRPLRVLYADIDARDAERTRLHLAQHTPHIRPTIVRDAAAVLSRLPADATPCAFDVLLLALQLDGDLDGLELARVLRHERRLDLPIVLIAAPGSEDAVTGALRLGIDDYLTKYEGYLHALPATLEKVRERAGLIRERAELRQTSKHLSHLLSASPTIIYTSRIRDGAFGPVWVSENVSRILGVPLAEVLAPGWWKAHVHPDDLDVALTIRARLLANGFCNEEYRLVRNDGGVFWIRDESRATRVEDGTALEVVGIWTEITARKHEELLQAARNAVLDRLVAGDPLPLILDDVARRLEQLVPEMRASILLLDEASGRLVHGAAPSLPDFYNDAVEGLEPREGNGTCGTAVFRREPVFAEDVRSDPGWSQYRNVAARVGFRACWAFPFHDAAGAVLGTFGVYFDRPRKRDPETVALLEAFSVIVQLAVGKYRANAALRQAAAVIESTRDGVMITDLARRIVRVNRAWCEITGFSRDEVIGKTPQLLKSGLQDDAFYHRMWTSVARTGHWQGEIWNRRKNGELYPQWLSISTVFMEENVPTHYVGVMTDISELKQSEAQLERLAHYDPLTDLPNRLLVQLRLTHAIAQAERHGAGLGVLFIDLDRFNNINDSLGHETGDELLIAISWRLRTRLRPEDTIARWGGDEFLVIVENLHKPDEAASVAQNLIDVMREPFTLADGPTVYVGASIGVSLFPQDGDNASELIRHADAALNQAKTQGRNTYRFFTEALSLAAQRHLDLDRRLRAALEQRSFELHYQPRIDIADGRIVGCEALLRWHDAEEGDVPPARFIPFAEESGLIVPIGEWVLDTACRQARAWLDAGLPPVVVAVNLSARQLWHADLPDRIAATLARTGLPPENLELELTESMIMGHEAQAEQRLRLLKSMGVRLAIDDFGTGYSSLSYLKNLPIELLKIDQSFIRNLPDDRNDMEITAGIIALAHKLKLKVLAEGVETDAQLGFLVEQGCDAYQGYRFSRPLPAQDFVRLLTDPAGARSK